MIIDCDNCSARGWHCSECVVSHLLGPPGRFDLDQEAHDALEVLADSGLVPPLRMVPVLDVSAVASASVEGDEKPARQGSATQEPASGQPADDGLVATGPDSRGRRPLRCAGVRPLPAGHSAGRVRRPCSEAQTPQLWTG